MNVSEITPEPERASDPESRPETRAEKPLVPLALEATSTERNPNGESAKPELDPELLEALTRAIERQGVQIKKTNPKLLPVLNPLATVLLIRETGPCHPGSQRTEATELRRKR
ncbi:unnamed protein product [Parnassius apollo]|uniref:(apollo) hypothetical protein n=1 Tax=Parnassius apollo TaxID=110799 RepID=A0A8S3XNG2_PARAO|nr:unnamed protein product [Parnassius apollo]